MIGLNKNTIKNAYLLLCEKQEELNAAAQELLKSLYCERGTGCGQCPACKKLLSGNHMDIRRLRPAGQSIRVDEVREAIEFSYERAYEGGFKTVVIQQAELMTEAAQNCLLKTIEEPPRGAIFLLLAKTRKSILNTVVSRCEVVTIMPIDRQEIEARLKADYSVSTLKARLIARLSGGFFREAVRLLEDEHFWEVRETALQLSEQILDAKGQPALSIAERIVPMKEDFPVLLQCMLTYYYDILKYGMTRQEELLVNIDRMAQIKQYAFCFTRGTLHNMIEIMLNTQMASGIPLNFRLMVESMLFHILEVKNDENHRRAL